MAVDNDHLDALLQEEQKLLIDRLTSHPRPRLSAHVITGSATKLPLADSSIDTILTSPPYLTRIDYAVAYARELAIMGIDISADRTLREHLMGTTLIRPSLEYQSNLGPTAKDLLAQVTQHKSRASSGYYKKQFQQYLDDLIASLTEISRAAKPQATMLLVVQDSYYKEIPIRLAEICAEEARRLNWTVCHSEPLDVIRNLTTINTAARAYPKGKVTETVITLRKA